MTPIPPTNLNQDNQSDHHLFNQRPPSFPCTIFFKTLQDQATSYSDHTNHHPHHHHQQKIKDHLLTHESSMDNTCDDDDQCSRDHEEIKWMSSKMRLMRKMMNQDSISNSSSGCKMTSIRVCSDCNTTKTPLWRSGPQGPKSLCNACGIRQRKARRAMAAAAALETGIIPADDTLKKNKKKKKVKKEKGSNVDQSMPFKKRFKILSSQENDKKKHYWFELSKSLSLHSVLPQDERDAAILLMALSYGLICG